MALDDSSAKGIGAFFYPTVLWVTESESPPIMDDELKPPRQKARKIVATHQLTDDKKIIVTDDGFLGLFSNNEKEAMDILNTIFAVGVTYGIGGEYLTSRDLCYFELYPTTNEIFFYRCNGPSERTMFSFYRDSNDNNEFQSWIQFSGGRGVALRSLLKLFDRVYEYTQKPELLKELLWALNGYSFHYRESYEGAYLYGWMLIEAFLDQVWEEHIESLQRSKQDKQALKDHRSWTTHHHIEMLSEIGRINPTVRNLLNKLRKKRNDVVHNRESVTDVESYSCLRVAIVIIVNRMKDPKNPFLNLEENNKLVDLWNCRE